MPNGKESCNMPFIDLHCDTFLELQRQNKELYDNDLHISLKKLMKSDVFCQFFAMYVNLAKFENDTQAFDFALSMYEVFKTELEKNKAYITQVCSAAELEEARRNGKIAALLTVEEGGICGNSIERIEKLYDMGVRLVTLTWNYENSLGYPNSDEPDIMGAGLKPFGIEFIERMQQLGMLIDVSHLSEGGFWDVVKYSKKPFVASHSNARAVRDFRRNLTDAQLKALAEAGGVTGINFYHNFLGADGSGSMEQIIAHIRQMKNIAGIDVIAVGSDFDGISGNTAMKDASELTMLIDALDKAGFTDGEIDKICWKNALRVIKDVL